MECNIEMLNKSVIYTVTYGNGRGYPYYIESSLSIIPTFAYPNAWILELAKGVRIIEVGL